MLLERVRNYGIVILLYVCSSYHLIYSEISLTISEMFLPKNLIIQTFGVQDIKLRSDTLPIYTFETFTFMTCFLIFNYFFTKRKYKDQTMGVRKFIDAFLFSQLAYIGLIAKILQDLQQANAFAVGMYLFIIYIPMFCLCYPLSRYLFKRRLKKLEAAIHNEDEKAADRRIIIDYAVVWVLALAAAVFVYSGNC